MLLFGCGSLRFADSLDNLFPICLNKFYRGTVLFDKSDKCAFRRAVRLNYYFFALNCFIYIINQKGYMWNIFYDFRKIAPFLISHPFYTVFALFISGVVDQSKLLSDKICTALQLTNFWQDVSVDLQKDRIYVPGDKVQIKSESEELIKNSNDETLTSNQTGKGHIAGDLGNDHIKELCRYTGRLFDDGAELINRLPTPLRYEIAWTVAGGKNILEKIKKIDYNVLSERVTLSKVDFLFLALKVFING